MPNSRQITPGQSRAINIVFSFLVMYRATVPTWGAFGKESLKVVRRGDERVV